MMTKGRKENVGGFEVAMEEIARVNVMNSFNDLLEYFA